MGSHPAETSQDWIQLLVIIGGKWTKAENVITAPCTLQKGEKKTTSLSLICMLICHSPLGETNLNLVIGARMNVHIEYVHVHEQRHTSVRSAQRQGDKYHMSPQAMI